MKMFDNKGNLLNEINTFFTSDGKTISSITTYSPISGQPTRQTVTEIDSQGRGKTTQIINGKILP